MTGRIWIAALTAMGLSLAAQPPALAGDKAEKAANAEEALPLTPEQAREKVEAYYKKKGKRVKIRSDRVSGTEYFATVVDTYNRPVGTIRVDLTTGKMSRQNPSD